VLGGDGGTRLLLGEGVGVLLALHIEMPGCKACRPCEPKPKDRQG
jgi:hypothetical protein